MHKAPEYICGPDNTRHKRITSSPQEFAAMTNGPYLRWDDLVPEGPSILGHCAACGSSLTITPAMHPGVALPAVLAVALQAPVVRKDRQGVQALVEKGAVVHTTRAGNHIVRR